MGKTSDLFALVFFCSLALFNVTSANTLSGPVDLTWDFGNNTIHWKGGQPFHFTKVDAGMKQFKFWVAVNEFCVSEHTGTHMDAPYHFKKDGLKLGEIPLKNLIAPGIVIDMRAEVERTGPNATLSPEHIINWEKENGPIPENAIVLVKFGYSKYYQDKNKYLGRDNENATSYFPGISTDAAHFLAEKYKISGVGVDTGSIDLGYSEEYPSHQILQGHNLFLMENVKLVEELPSRNFTLLALPMNIGEGTGGPLRLVAVPKGYL